MVLLNIASHCIIIIHCYIIIVIFVYRVTRVHDVYAAAASNNTAKTWKFWGFLCSGPRIPG